MSELEIIQHRKINGISVFFDTVEYRTPHFHPEWELIWITEGRISVQCGGRRLEGGPDELFLFSPNQVHEFSQIGEPVTFLCLQAAPQCFAAVCPELQALTAERVRLCECLREEELAELRGLLRSLMDCYLEQGPLFALDCAGMTARLLALLLGRIPAHPLSEEEQSSADKRSARLSRFLSFVDENYMHKIKLADFAESEGVSLSYLSRFLKENLNQTFQDYVNSIRFYSACRMIRAGGRRMLDVCEEAGFSDYRYFSRCFKKFAGVTPEEYSRTALPEGEKQVQKSIYSRERFYTREESRQILRSL